MTTARQRDEWRRLADAAWPGPWALELDRNDQQNVYADDRTWIALLPHQCVRSIEEERERDAAFIVAARTAVPALLTENENLRLLLAQAAERISLTAQSETQHGNFRDDPDWQFAEKLRRLLEDSSP